MSFVTISPPQQDDLATRRWLRSPVRAVIALVSAVLLAGGLALSMGAPAAAAPTKQVALTVEGPLEFSKDGETWYGGADASKGLGAWDPIVGQLSPGRSGGRTYYIKNVGQTAGTLSLRMGIKSMSDNALYTLWTNIGAKDGTKYVVYGPAMQYYKEDFDLGPELHDGQVVNSITLRAGEVVEVRDNVGHPSEAKNDSQNSSLSVDYDWELTEDCAAAAWGSSSGSLSDLLGNTGSSSGSSDGCGSSSSS